MKQEDRQVQQSAMGRPAATLNTIRTMSSFFAMPSSVTLKTCINQPAVAKALSIDPSSATGQIEMAAISAIPLSITLGLNMLFVSDIQKDIAGSIEALDKKYRHFFAEFDAALINSKPFQSLQKLIELDLNLFGQFIAENQESFSEGCYYAKTTAITGAWLALSMNPCSTMVSPVLASALQIGQTGAQTITAVCVIRSQNEIIQNQLKFLTALQKSLQQIDKYKDLAKKVLSDPEHLMHARLSQVLQNFEEDSTFIMECEDAMSKSVSLHKLHDSIASTLEHYHNQIAFSVSRPPTISSMSSLNGSRDSLGTTADDTNSTEEPSNTSSSITPS